MKRYVLLTVTALALAGCSEQVTHTPSPPNQETADPQAGQPGHNCGQNADRACAPNEKPM